MSWCEYCPRYPECTDDPRGCELADQIEEQKRKEFFNSDWGSRIKF